jgi:endonuclease-3
MANNASEFQAKIKLISQGLIGVFGLPEWRPSLSPVDELVSTILSQNTNDVNRDAAFEQLKAAFPNWRAVMEAEEEKVIDAIRTAGLANQKGPRIQGALRYIADQTGGEISLEFLKEMGRDKARDWLMNVKGVGPKTAAIVLLFAMDIPAFPVDTHIYRVTGRIGIRPENLSVEKTHKYLEDRIPEAYYYDLHLNLIKLGREVCGARKWHCYRCPVEDLCEFDDKRMDPSKP